MRAVDEAQPEWYVLENPVGRLVHYLGKPCMYYQPHEFAGWADDPASEAYTKKTCLWGEFNAPMPCDVGNQLGSKMHKVGPGKNRANIRSKTPQGFARAFFYANP